MFPILAKFTTIPRPDEIHSHYRHYFPPYSVCLPYGSILSDVRLHSPDFLARNRSSIPAARWQSIVEKIFSTMGALSGCRFIVNRTTSIYFALVML